MCRHQEPLQALKYEEGGKYLTKKMGNDVKFRWKLMKMRALLLLE